jgi:hypothetical protein
LADWLSESAGGVDEQEVDEASMREIERRATEIDAGTAELIPAEDVIAELRENPRR